MKANEQIPPETLDRVARRVASAWRRRGIRSYSYEDIYQDAVAFMYAAVKNYDPEKATSGLEAYLTKCCVLRVGDRLTRVIHPVSARSNDEVRHLRNLKAVQLPKNLEADQRWVEKPYYDELVALTRIRESMLAAVGGDAVGLELAMGVQAVKDITRDKAEARVLYQRAQTAKRRLRQSATVYRLFKEYVSP